MPAPGDEIALNQYGFLYVLLRECRDILVFIEAVMLIYVYLSDNIFRIGTVELFLLKIVAL